MTLPLGCPFPSSGAKRPYHATDGGAGSMGRSPHTGAGLGCSPWRRLARGSLCMWCCRGAPLGWSLRWAQKKALQLGPCSPIMRLAYPLKPEPACGLNVAVRTFQMLQPPGGYALLDSSALDWAPALGFCPSGVIMVPGVSARSRPSWKLIAAGSPTSWRIRLSSFPPFQDRTQPLQFGPPEEIMALSVSAGLASI